MVIGIFGESCTGKSTLAQMLEGHTGGEVITGKDYLRLAKNENMAKVLFRKKLENALTGEPVIYVISEREHLSFLPDGAVRILVTAELDTIQSRFAQRMGGKLPTPVAAMLERKHGCFDHEPHDLKVESGMTDLDEVCRKVASML